MTTSKMQLVSSSSKSSYTSQRLL